MNIKIILSCLSCYMLMVYAAPNESMQGGALDQGELMIKILGITEEVDQYAFSQPSWVVMQRIQAIRDLVQSVSDEQDRRELLQTVQILEDSVQRLQARRQEHLPMTTVFDALNCAVGSGLGAAIVGSYVSENPAFAITSSLLFLVHFFRNCLENYRLNLWNVSAGFPIGAAGMHSFYSDDPTAFCVVGILFTAMYCHLNPEAFLISKLGSF